MKNLKYFELIAKNEDDKSKWIATLAKVAVRSDFQSQLLEKVLLQKSTTPKMPQLAKL